MIRVGSIALALALVAAPALAEERVEFVQSELAPIVVQLDGIATGSLVTMLMRDVMKVPYVIAPDILADRRPMSVRLVIPRHQVPETVVPFLRRSGFSVDLAGGALYVSRSGASGGFQPGLPSGSPLVSDGLQTSAFGSAPAAAVPDPEPVEMFGYIPAHRDPAYLAQVVGSLLPDLRFGGRGEIKADAAQQEILARNGPDLLIVAGSADDLVRARQLVSALDRPRPLVAVKAVVMSVRSNQARGSALSILAKLAGGNFSLGSYPGEPPAAQFVRIASGASSAVLSAVREDGRFKVVATPNLVALSGAVAKMNAGSQVPTIGAVSVSDGVAVQSVEYRDSGITLTVRPVVRGDLIELDVQEERSTFVRTTTGVSDSPTLERSSASAQVILKSGESVALAGLTENSEGDRREGLLGGLLGIRSRDKSESEMLVLIQAELVPLPDVDPGSFVEFDKSEDPA